MQVDNQATSFDDAIKQVKTFQYWRKKRVKEETGIDSDSTLYYLVRTKELPKPYKLSGRLSAWRSDEIEEWKLSRQHAEIAGA